MTEYVVVDQIGTSEFRRRLSHHLGRVRYGGHCLAIHRKNEDPVYLIAQADFDLLRDRIADVEDGPLCRKTDKRWGGMMQYLRALRRYGCPSEDEGWDTERESNDSAADAPEKTLTPMQLIDRANARLGNPGWDEE